MTLAAVLLFAAATFQIADGNTLLGVVFFGAASCFSSLAGILRERETEEAQQTDQPVDSNHL